MNADPARSGSPASLGQDDGNASGFDLRHAQGVQLGSYNTQNIYFFGERTVTDGVSASPIADDSGTVESPYRGLSAFEENDARFFFGRETAAADVLTLMSQHLDGIGLITVSGASGAGKSSLLRAGVLPQVREEGLASAPEAASWHRVLFTPGRAPLNELATWAAGLAGSDAAAVKQGLGSDPSGFALTARQAALTALATRGESLTAPPGRPPRLLLVIDQFEQLFTQCPDEEQRRAFIVAIHAAATIGHGPSQAPAALVLLGVRADFEARCADYPQLAEAVQNRYLVTPMTPRQLRMAITEPAKQVNASVDDDLTELLLRDAGTGNGRTPGAGALPLLSHALDEAWRNSDRNVLRVADYERVGGIEGAVAKSAERAYTSLSPARQAEARQVFLHLTVTSSTGVDTSARASRAELTEGKTTAQVQDVEAVLEAFAAERLLTLAKGTVEISHEILLTAWPLLHDVWLAENRADRIARTRLHNAAAEWADHSRDPSYLYSGSLLSGAVETEARIEASPARLPSLGPAERDFLGASRRVESRKRYRQRFLFVLAAVVVVSLVSAGALIGSARQETGQERGVLASTQLVGASEALGDADPVVSRLESVAAWDIHPSDDARHAMLAAAALPGTAILTGHTGTVWSVAFSPNGKTLASGSADGTVRLWNVATGHETMQLLAGSGGGVQSVAFSPDGKTLATGDENGIVQFWQVATGRQAGPGIGSTALLGSVESVAFSPDGKTLATGDSKGTVRLWNVVTGGQVGPALTGPGTTVFSVAFSPDGKTLATANFDGTVRLWNVARGRQVGSPPYVSTGAVSSVAFSPDGKTLASTDDDGTVRLWKVANGRAAGNPLSSGDNSSIVSVAFSPDGTTLASGSVDGDVRLWDTATGLQTGNPLTGHTGTAQSLAFSPDGKTLASGSDDDTVRLWNVGVSRQIVHSSADGNATALAKADNSPAAGSRAVGSVEFSLDGKTLATAYADGSMRLSNVSSGRQVGTPLTGSRLATSAAISPDGKTLATGYAAASATDYNDGSARLWDVTTGQPIGGPLSDKNGEVESVAFSPDGKTLATGYADGSVQLWKVATGQPTGKPLINPAGAVESVAFSPDSKILASSSLDNAVRLWNVTSGHQIGKPLTGHSGEVDSIAFSPDSKILATGSDDDTARLWDVATGQPIGNPLTGDTRAVSSVAFSPDGKTLATGSFDDTVRLWDVTTGLPIADPLLGDSGDVYTVAFSPDGRTLATGSLDGTLRLWNVPYLVDTVRQVCAGAGRSLTVAEWARYVPPGPAYQNVCPAAPSR